MAKRVWCGLYGRYEAGHFECKNNHAICECATTRQSSPPTEVAPVAPVGLSGKKCSCVYATAANTESVRKGFEMGGYLKKECEACRRASPATAPQASEKPSKPFGWVVACERKGSVFRLSRIVPSEAHAQPIVKQWTEEHTPGIFDIVAMPLFKTPASHAETAPQASEPKTVAYPDADLSCGLSTNGVLICGSSESIKQVKGWLHSVGVADSLRAELMDTRAALAATQATGAGDALDTKRLEWLIEHETHVREVNGAFTLFGVGRFASGREAIDAAMKKFPQQEGSHADQA